MGLADLQADAGESELAAFTLRQAVEVQPEDSVARVKLGLLLWTSGRDARQTQEPEGPSPEHSFAEAEKHLQMATELNPQSDEAYYNLGLVQRDRGRTEAARDSLERALDLNPNDDEYAQQLEELEYADGDLDVDVDEIGSGVLGDVP
eukprot:CAMPEP_0171251888 /NCGR_PEP_ID=MMETSP0790-20130122/50874_1 /TAXON_ID=2925 /ORGANISM="Alexandrium catenella, Strain OF101" /LENGTH=147 /DNA_ID=CAMNT_0011719605 /DNA_START=9 /DNA_END=448 /DNA_ORIENTATION=-